MLILVIGLPGSGKSSAARYLANELNGVVVNSDIIRRELFPISRNYSSQETKRVIKEIERKVKELLEKGCVVILDALFTKHAPRDKYRELANSIGVPFKLVYVVAPEVLIKERMDERQLKGDASEAVFSYYLDRKPHFEPIKGEYFMVSNDGNLQELELQIRKLAKQIS